MVAKRWTACAGKIAIRHGVANDHWLSPLPAQFSGDQARDRALAASGAHRAYGNDWDRRLDLRVLGSQKPEIGVRSHRARGKMHQVLVGNVAVGKHHRANLILSDQFLDIFLFEDRNAIRIEASGKLRRIAAPRNIGDLSGRECDHLVVGIIAE